MSYSCFGMAISRSGAHLLCALWRSAALALPGAQLWRSALALSSGAVWQSPAPGALWRSASLALSRYVGPRPDLSFTHRSVFPALSAFPHPAIFFGRSAPWQLIGRSYQARSHSSSARGPSGPGSNQVPCCCAMQMLHSANFLPRMRNVTCSQYYVP